MSEHRLLGITIDNKLRWDSHINNVYITVSRRVFLLSKLRYIIDIDTRKLFFNAQIKPHIDYASVVIVQELCESRGGRSGLSVLTSLQISVDVKLY